MNKSVLAGIVSVPVLMIGVYANAQASHAPNAAMSASSDSVAPDNTKSNKVDASNQSAAADKQRNDSADIDLTKRIRQSVMADKTLSTYAHNVKIVAVDGTVTLNGVVSTADEKMRIGKKARSIAGEGHVVDDLKVVAQK
jgi:hyperosmotically inducible periplasmic protein